jgi:acetyltransferase-like isoleucine patch superfamily enzyme
MMVSYIRGLILRCLCSNISVSRDFYLGSGVELFFEEDAAIVSRDFGDFVHHKESSMFAVEGAPTAVNIGGRVPFLYMEHPHRSSSKIRLKKEAKLVVGKNVSVCPGFHFHVWAGKDLILCDHTYVGNDVLIATKHGVELGKGSMVGRGSQIIDYDGHPCWSSDEDGSDISIGGKSAPIKIGSKVWIGFNTTILKGVTIGDGAVVGMGSVVTSDIPAGALAAGNPAKIIKKGVKWRLY